MVFVGRGAGHRHHGRGDAGGGTTCLHMTAFSDNFVHIDLLLAKLLAKTSVAGEKQDRFENSCPVIK
jgi:hypothetical protein